LLVAKFEFLYWLPTKKYEISDREIPDDNAPILTFGQASSAYKTEFGLQKKTQAKKNPGEPRFFKAVKIT
jgi:nitrate reductase beta subunit